MERAMNTTIRIACTLAAFASIGAAAFAQGTSTSTTTTTVTPPASTQADTQATQAVQTAEQREKARLEAEAARNAAAGQATVDQARKEMERAKQHIEQAQKQAQKQADKEVAKEVARVQEALKEAQRELELYAKGTAALDTARYEKALEAFAEAAALKGEKADSSLYWKAFSEYKAQALQAALESIKQMQKSFPDSRWLEQALALEFEVKASMGKPVLPAATPDEELKLLALNSLMHTDAEQALPMLEKMISGQQSPRLKQRALFVVSQSKSPRAREILTSVARGSSSPDLQLEALRYLGMLGGPEDRKLLSDVYTVSKDRDVKLRVVDALFMAGDAKALVDMARKETDQEMRKRIVERLSRMKAKEATDYMIEIIDK
jgi:tetratricopeptide (TPR) repeat protein